MDKSATEVSALSAQKSSDSGFQVILHPLPILEISDYITRASERGFKGAIVGILLGQINGREITVEHSFSCRTVRAGNFYDIDVEWFKERLAQSTLTARGVSLCADAACTRAPKC